MPPPSETRPIRFVAENPVHRRRVAFGVGLLIGAASWWFWLLGRIHNDRLIHAAERGWARAAAALLRLQLDIEGVGNIDGGERYVVVALHEGFADAIALLHLGLPMRFLVRDELFDWPALGRYLGATHQIKVDEPLTDGSVRAMYRQVEAAFAGGDSLVVFAQGSILGVEVAFQRGAFRLARSLGRPVLPVVISGSHLVWEHPYGTTVRLDQRISVRVLPPVAPDRLDEATTRGLERTMKSIALDVSTAPARHFDPEADGWWDGYRYEIDPDYPELAERLARHRVEPG